MLYVSHRYQEYDFLCEDRKWYYVNKWSIDTGRTISNGCKSQVLTLQDSIHLKRGTIIMETQRKAVHVIMEIFPEEIIIEILARLPVKSLLRFKCVSKSWFIIISSSQFIKAHLYASSKNSIQYRFICRFARYDYHFRQCSLSSFLHEPDRNSITVDYPAIGCYSPMRIVGSCHGMVCVALHEEILYLWNPSIRKYKRLPCLHMRSRYGCYLKDGFGYDEANDDYKVVAIFFCIFGAGPCKVQIYSLKTGIWRKIKDFKGLPLDHSGKYARGKLHWLSESRGRLDIVSLNLTSEKYQIVEAPKYTADHSSQAMNGDSLRFTLGLFSDSLCVLCDDYETRMDLWVMEDGVKDSWVKLFTIPYLGDPGMQPHMTRLQLLNKDEMLVVFGHIMGIYNMRDKLYRYPQIDAAAAVCQADIYAESLVSPNSDGI